MQKFVAVYCTPQSEIKKFLKMPEAKRNKLMQDEMKKWNAWLKKYKKNIADAGEIFGKTKRITRKGIADVKNELTGYSVIKANNHSEAARIMKSNPQLWSGRSRIELMVCLDIPKGK